MDLEQLQVYFANNKIFSFNGNEVELENLMHSNGVSFNYIINQGVYFCIFVDALLFIDDRIIEVTE